MRVDPSGMDAEVNGISADLYVEELQKSAGNQISIIRDQDSGCLSYIQNGEGNLEGNAKIIADIIDDHSMTVNIFATNDCYTREGN